MSPNQNKKEGTSLVFAISSNRSHNFLMLQDLQRHDTDDDAKGNLRRHGRLQGQSVAVDVFAL